MPKVTIVADDKKVRVGDELYTIDVTFPENLHAIQMSEYDPGTDVGKGHIEFKDKTPNQPLTNLGKYKHLYNAWVNEKAKVEALKSDVNYIKAEKSRELEEQALSKVLGIATGSGQLVKMAESIEIIEATIQRLIGQLGVALGDIRPSEEVDKIVSAKNTWDQIQVVRKKAKIVSDKIKEAKNSTEASQIAVDLDQVQLPPETD